MRQTEFITIPRTLIKIAREFPSTDWNEVMRYAVKADVEAMKNPTNSRGHQWVQSGIYRDTATGKMLIKKDDADRLPTATKAGDK